MNKDFTQSVLAGFAICSCNENVIKPGFYCDLPHASHEIKGLLEYLWEGIRTLVTTI